MCAASNNRIEIVKILVQKGADVKLKASSGWTALHYAVCNTKISLDILKILIDAGSDPAAEVTRFSSCDSVSEFLATYRSSGPKSANKYI
jgi:ankyrin repeat protein